MTTAATTWAGNRADLIGEVKCDGSSTVYLITEAMASHFRREHPRVKVSVGISGTGGGFKKFATGETDISNASRTIRPSEIENCARKGIEFLELQVAWDGLTVVIHPENTWAESMTVAQLRAIWHPDQKARKWSDVDPSWPNEEIKLYGAGPDSGTFDFFTEAINGKEKISRTDYQASEDDNVLVKGVAGNRFAMGFFGYAYYEENSGMVKAVRVSMGPGQPAVAPTLETVMQRTYKPLSRPLLIYVKTSSLKRPEVQEFTRFYLKRNDIVRSARYIQMGARLQARQQDKLDAAIAAASGSGQRSALRVPPSPFAGAQVRKVFHGW